jgi:hypothetical protein
MHLLRFKEATLECCRLIWVNFIVEVIENAIHPLNDLWFGVLHVEVQSTKTRLGKTSYFFNYSKISIAKTKKINLT